MLTFLFWNVGRRSLDGLIAECVLEHEVDIVMLAEFPGDADDLANAISASGPRQFLQPFAPASKITILSSLPPGGVRPVWDDQTSDRLTIRRVVLEKTDMLLGVVHLPSKVNWSNEDQAAEAREIASKIREIESGFGHDRTVLVGDFNMNPFEAGIVSANGFHGVMTRELASRGTRVVQEREYPFLYNPMWGFLGDRSSGPAGTFFHGGGGRHVEYFWNTFDQVLLRPSLLTRFRDEVAVVESIGATNLLRDNGRVNATIGSDHLPLLFSLHP